MNKHTRKLDDFLRKICLDRVGNKCEVCGNGGTLDPHHVLPKSVYPQHRGQPMNIVVLCRIDCHGKAEGADGREWLLGEMIDSQRFYERMDFYADNVEVNKYPTEVDYEKQLEDLKASISK